MENKLNYSKQGSVYLPSDDGSYSIRTFDWNRLKRIAENSAGKKNLDFKVLYSILYGIGGSSGISIIPLQYSDNLPAWVTPLYLIATVFSFGFAIVLTLMDNKAKKDQKLTMIEMKFEMDEIEKLFPGPQIEKVNELQQPTLLKIINARYFTQEKSIDVTNELIQLIKDNRLEVIANNEIAGDPHYKAQKELEVTYEFKGVRKTKKVIEKQTLIIEN